MVDVSPALRSPAKARRLTPNTKIAVLKAREAKPNAFILNVTFTLRVMMFRSQIKTMKEEHCITANVKHCPRPNSFPPIICLARAQAISHVNVVFDSSSMVAGGFQSYHNGCDSLEGAVGVGTTSRQSNSPTSLHWLSFQIYLKKYAALETTS
jgi:hypothetical protein